MKDVIEPVSSCLTLTQAEWHSFKDLIYKVTGIALSPAKKSLLVARLGRRLRALGLPSFTEYYDRILNRDLAGEELQALVNAITTNKTEFFREPHHFELLEEWLETPSPSLQQARLRGLRIWCAAASTGEEPYTIAGVVRSALSQSEWERTTIMATDLDTHALEKASAGRYEACELEGMPAVWQDRLFNRVLKDGRDDRVIRPDLRARVQFGQVNLVKGGWRIPKPLDAIFCRNVLIYFDRATQLEVVRRQHRMLAPHGLLFLGHSEGLMGLELQLESVGHTVYRASTNCDQSARTSIPPLRAVSLSDAVPARQRQYVIGAQGERRLSLRSGVMVAMFSSRAGQSCIAVLKEDCWTPAGRQQARRMLESMLCALQQLGGRVDDIQVKSVGVVGESGPCTEKNTSELQSTVRDWLFQSSLTLTAERQVPAHTEIRINMRTGRVRLRSQLASSTDVKPTGSVPSDVNPRKAGNV